MKKNAEQMFNSLEFYKKSILCFECRPTYYLSCRRKIIDQEDIMIPPLGYKRWVVNEAEQTLDLYCSTKFGMQCLAIIEQMGDSTFECHLQKQRCAYTKEVLHGTLEEVKAKIENDIIQSLKKELNRLKRAIGVYENFIAIFTEEETSSEIELDEIKAPAIRFVPLKKGITEDELNDYIAESEDSNFLVYLRYRYNTDVFKQEWQYSVEAASCGCECDGRVCWLNDWWEGQQDVEYLAISKLGE